jgi:hypothetical protein
MKWILPVLLATALHASSLPEAPKPQKILSWDFLAVHAVYGASNAFDNYETQRHLGVCAFEGNPDLGRTPTAKAQAIHGAVEFAAVVAGDALLKWYGRHQGIPRWLNSVGGSSFAIIGLTKHTHAGMQWVNLCD